MSSLIRTRWAAIGAAVAVSLGGGGLTMVGAAPTQHELTVYTPIEPCRLLDTRPNHGIGGRTTPLGPAETYAVTAHGSNGECVGIPANSTAVGLNVTAVSPTELTHLTIWPDGPVPNASSLNPSPGQPPTPNAVTTELDAGGSFQVFNNSGSVHLIVDVVGFYSATLPFTAAAEAAFLDSITDELEPMVSVAIAAPTNGMVALFSTASVFHTTEAGSVMCYLLRSTDADFTPGPALPYTQQFQAGSAAQYGSLAGTRTFHVYGGTTSTFDLRCAEYADGGQVGHATITAVFTPDP